METNKAFHAHIRRNLITGVLIMIPLWITWLVFGFLFSQLSRFGRPWVRGMSRAVESLSPSLAEWLLTPWFQSLLAVIVTLLLLYLLGWITSRMVGRHLLALLESFIARIPLVQVVYGAAKKLIAALQQKPEQVQRVVLIEFPTPEMRALGFVTQILTDQNTGQKLAAVYVPTTPNPTSGYMEIVPIERLVNTDWSVDEAMSFIISGGTISPGNINFENKEKTESASPGKGKDETTGSH